MLTVFCIWVVGSACSIPSFMSTIREDSCENEVFGYKSVVTNFDL